jgi:hypothetical protein
MSGALAVHAFPGRGLATDDEPAVETGQLEDVEDGLDPISDEIGRTGYFANFTADGCLLPADEEDHAEAAVFDRFYFALVAGDEPVLVDILPGGSEAECAAQAAARHVDIKRQWCEANGVTYRVEAELLSPIAMY